MGCETTGLISTLYFTLRESEGNGSMEVIRERRVFFKSFG